MSKRHSYPTLPTVRLLTTALLAFTLLWSCDVHEFPDEPGIPDTAPRIEVAVSFDDTEWPELSTVEYLLPGSRGSRAEEHSMRYLLNIFQDEAGSRVPSRSVVVSKFLLTDIPASLSDVMESIPVELKPGSYSAIVWVDCVEANLSGRDLYYNTRDFTSISILGDDHPGNCHHREAFRGQTHFIVDTDGTVLDSESRSRVEAVPVTVSRPQARFEFITTDLEDFVRSQSRTDSVSISAGNTDAPALMPPNTDDYTVRFRYTSYMPSTYNAFTNKPVDSQIGVSFDGAITRLSETEASLGFDHVFVNGTEASVQVALDIYRSADNSLIASTNPITVPLRRNRHTIVRGRFLTTNAGGGVSINPGFNGSYDIEIQ